ncbi:hypothetical protein KIN20_007033 [Parelaphostrongylus tenuis]|uniref:Uncharacterized protein n=1 Tax=Parelaphostrongylus tenuis TaxID=148309 RepID=A0AAD5QLL3_PARTN|nr:hypothetical protein KIN20_007033 [Parelaphostrongylus tenuis]
MDLFGNMFQVFAKHARSFDILQLLTKVNHRVAYCFQTSCSSSYKQTGLIPRSCRQRKKRLRGLTVESNELLARLGRLSNERHDHHRAIRCLIDELLSANAMKAAGLVLFKRNE